MGEGAASAWELEVQRGLTHCSEHPLTEILWPEPQTKCPNSMKMPLEGASSGLWHENQILLCSYWQKISQKHNQFYYYYYIELLLRRVYTRQVQQSPEVKSMASGESGQCLNPARHLQVVWPGASYMTSLCLGFFISKTQITTVTCLICFGRDYSCKMLRLCLEHNKHSIC